MTNPKRFPTKKQQINTLQQGQGFDDGRKFTIAEYKVMADQFYADWCAKHHAGQTVDQATLAKDYWNIVETSSREVAVEYGNDLDTTQYASGFLRKHRVERPLPPLPPLPLRTLKPNPALRPLPRPSNRKVRCLARGSQAWYSIAISMPTPAGT
jgi:hypothetical protein